MAIGNEACIQANYAVTGFSMGWGLPTEKGRERDSRGWSRASQTEIAESINSLGNITGNARAPSVRRQMLVQWRLEFTIATGNGIEGNGFKFVARRRTKIDKSRCSIQSQEARIGARRDVYVWISEGKKGNDRDHLVTIRMGIEVKNRNARYQLN
jgi:hypothetical protein